MCERDGCPCGIPDLTISDIAKNIAESNPLAELETPTNPSNTQTE